MKIALCVSSLPLSGVGTSIGIVRRGLIQAGHEVDIVITAPDPGDDCETMVQKGWSVRCCGQGVRFMRDRLQLTLACLARYAVVINNHSIETQLVAPCLPGKTARLSVMRVLNDSAIEQLSVNSRFFHCAIAISREMQRVMEQTPGIKCPVRLIANSTEARADEMTGIKRPVRIAYVGRIQDRDKNVMILPEILQALAGRHIEYRMKIAGDGEDLNRLAAEIERRGLSQTVTLLGSVSREEARTLLEESHCTVLPSFYEGLSNVMLESMALGSVPIVSDLENFKWVLGHEFDKLKAPVSTARVYAKRIAYLAHNPGEYARIQRYLWDRQRTMFTPRATVDGYLELIDDVKKTYPSCRPEAVELDRLQLPPKYAWQCASWWRLAQHMKDTIVPYTQNVMHKAGAMSGRRNMSS